MPQSTAVVLLTVAVALGACGARSGADAAAETLAAAQDACARNDIDACRVLALRIVDRWPETAEAEPAQALLDANPAPGSFDREGDR